MPANRPDDFQIVGTPSTCSLRANAAFQVDKQTSVRNYTGRTSNSFRRRVLFSLAVQIRADGHPAADR